jgi:hypothetical protein
MVSGTSGINAPTEGETLPEQITQAAHDVEVDDAWLRWLPSVLDTLLPANEHLPAAGQMGLATAVLDDATWSPEFTEALQWLDHELSPEFTADDQTRRTATLRALEETEPRHFAAIVNLAYNAYYIHPDVLALIESVSGFVARPPQPLGYELEPFDPAIMTRIRQRAPFWRKA